LDSVDKDRPRCTTETFRQPEDNIVEDRIIGVARSILSTRHLCRATVSAHLGRRESLLGFARIAELGPESTNCLAAFRWKVQALAVMIELGSDPGGYLEWVYADLGFETNYHRLTVRLESSQHRCCFWSFGFKAAHEVGGIALFLENLHIHAMMLFQNSLWWNPEGDYQHHSYIESGYHICHPKLYDELEAHQNTL